MTPQPCPLPSRDRTGLVVIDVQEKLVPFLDRKEHFLATIEFLVRTVRLLELPVLVTEQYPKGLGPTEAVVREWLTDSPRVEKITFSACGEPAFEEALGRLGIVEPILCGIEAHICVLQTALDLLGSGRVVYLASDAVASRHAHDREAGVETARRAGAVVTTAETVAFGLFERAGSEEFKAMQKLVRQKDEALARTLPLR
ncbi:MAG: isochorismatase family protein [Planctomycetes bacterium]|nr:isochorismatase family protein [Planctomycetota bacterium]